MKRERSRRSMSMSQRAISSTYVISSCTFSSSGRRSESLIARFTICAFASVLSSMNPVARMRSTSGATFSSAEWNSPTSQMMEARAVGSSMPLVSMISSFTSCCSTR